MSDEHHSLMKPYGFILLALLGLTGLTVAAAYVDFGHPWSDLAALAIALFKASLVVAFFMHVKGSTSMIKIAVFSGVFWLAIFFVLILADYMTRVITFTG
jgi:cytochrome c oxidase subunit 4